MDRPFFSSNQQYSRNFQSNNGMRHFVSASSPMMLPGFPRSSSALPFDMNRTVALNSQGAFNSNQPVPQGGPSPYMLPNFPPPPNIPPPFMPPGGPGMHFSGFHIPLTNTSSYSHLNGRMPYIGQPAPPADPPWLQHPPPLPQQHNDAKTLFQHHVGSITASSSQSSHLSTDELMVEEFLRKIGKLNSSGKYNLQKDDPPNFVSTTQPKKLLKICEAKELQQRAWLLIRKLEDCLCNPLDSPDIVSGFKNELNDILSQISDQDVVKDLQKKIFAKRKKRDRLRRSKSGAFSRKNQEERRISEINEEIKKWQEKQRNEYEEQMREKEMQKQLDEALVELRKELAFTTKSLEIINALSNLRKIRLNSLKSKGKDVPSDHVNERFAEVGREAKQMLASHKATCEKKISSLKIFMEAEQKEAKLAIERKKARKLQEDRRKWEEEREFVLFGKSNEVDAFDPLWPVQELHKQANLSLQGLIQYRRIWDQFLHEDGDKVPSHWVEPTLPSSETWALYHEKNNPSK